MPQLDPTWYASQAFWMLITFGTMFFALWKLVLPSMTKVIDGRKHRLEEDLTKAESLKNEAENIQRNYQNALSSGNESVRYKMEQSLLNQQKEFKVLEEAFSKRMESRVEEAEKRLEKEKQAVISNISDISADLVVDIAKKIAHVDLDARRITQHIQTAMEKKS